MFKRPQLREAGVSIPSRKSDIQEGTFLHSIVNPKPANRYKNIKRPIYRKEDYIRLLEKNRRDLGLEPVDIDIPDYEAPTRPVKQVECHIRALDRVHIQLRVLKSGVVRIKLITSLYDMYEDYYMKQQTPPLKTIIQVYKSLGYSNEFLERVIKLHDRKMKIVDNFDLDSIFNKEMVKKQKKKKEELKEEEEREREDDEEDEDEDNIGEDEEMDVECDEDDELVEQNDEEFIDDED